MIKVIFKREIPADFGRKLSKLIDHYIKFYDVKINTENARLFKKVLKSSICSIIVDYFDKKQHIYKKRKNFSQRT